MILASHLANFLGKELIGPDVMIKQVSSINNPKEHSLLFIKSNNSTIINQLSDLPSSIVLLVNEKISKEVPYTHIVSDNPRLDFGRLVNHFFYLNAHNNQSLPILIGDDVKLGENISFGKNVLIGNKVTIGSQTIIGNNVVISDNVHIGDHCIIKSNSVIGEEGFAFERDDHNVPIKIPHLGGVKIGNYVEIGPLTIIVRGTIDNTIIEDNVKIDGHVHIAHNVHIEQNCIITPCSMISGSVYIKKNTWLSPNCTLMNGISIGENVLIGLGSVVTKSIDDHLIVAGNPARTLRINSK